MSDYYSEQYHKIDSKKTTEMSNSDIYEWAVGRAAAQPDWAKKYLSKGKSKDKAKGTGAKKISANAVGYGDSRTSKLDHITVWRREDDDKVATQKRKAKGSDTIDLTPGV